MRHIRCRISGNSLSNTFTVALRNLNSATKNVNTNKEIEILRLKLFLNCSCVNTGSPNSQYDKSNLHCLLKATTGVATSLEINPGYFRLVPSAIYVFLGGEKIGFLGGFFLRPFLYTPRASIHPSIQSSLGPKKRLKMRLGTSMPLFYIGGGSCRF